MSWRSAGRALPPLALVGLLLCGLVLEGSAAGGSALLGVPSAVLRGVSQQAAAATRELGNDNNSTNNNRVTWNNCKCKKKWDFEDIGSCKTSCCNPDNDTLGEWCLVEDEACEESDWGYCRPANYQATPCQDSPPGWVDAEVDGCSAYGMNSWCTITGDYGTGWDKSWGTFADFTNQGHTAATACCNCGGGANVSEQCADTPGWSDSDGDGCMSYQEANWCNHMGGYGVGWHEEWGVFANFTNQGKTAFDACCACGGGDFSATARPGGDSGSPRTRTTLLGCECKKEWQDEITGINCNGYCCNPDRDPNGDWCYVKDVYCEDSDWGYCRDGRPEAEACADTPAAWTDSYGYDCSDYATMQFCTHTGGYGTGWKDDWGTFDQYWHDGHTAYTACCVCGGGGSRDSGYQSGCQDSAGWNDTDGDTCGSYRDDQWCTATGGYGWGWHEEWGTFADHAKELSAPQACCACGGGSTNNFQANPNAKGLEPSPTPAPGAPAPTPSESSNETRKTWNGCECKKSWSEADLSCENYCCNPDDDEYGNWCFVKEESCEEASWGYCIPLGGNSEHGGCTDLQGWTDAEGDGCWVYGDSGWCKEDGTPGSGWDKEWGMLDDYFSQGHSSTTACCACGGGNRDDSAEKDVCTNTPNWKDDDGDGCDAYEEFKWCTSTGEYGIGWHEEWGNFRGSPTAPKACCYCGGGSGGSSATGARTEILAAAAPAAAGGSASTKEAEAAVEGSGGAAAGGVAAVFVVVVVAGLLGGWYFYKSKKTKAMRGESVHLRPEGSPIQGSDMPGPGAIGIGKKYQPCEDL